MLTLDTCVSHWVGFKTRLKRPRAWTERDCGGSCHVLDAQLPIYEVDLWVDIKGLPDAELCLLCSWHCCALGGWWNLNNTVECSKKTLGYINI